MTTSTYIPVLLSIVNKPNSRGVIHGDCRTPEELYEAANLKDMETQVYLQKEYGSVPSVSAKKIISRCMEMSVKITSIWDDEYPPLLKQIPNPPTVIYSKGDCLGKTYISMVGTRDATENSVRISRKIASEISGAGFTVVSGMALGVDRNCHIGALDGNGGTVAVLPGSIDCIYPFQNRDIYDKITESDNSGFISEYPPLIRTGQKWTFARRNRIISGLSEFLIIIQAKEKSGAMITARCAIEQNRTILACCGNFGDDRFSGCASLIKEGAFFVHSVEDIMSEIMPGQKYVAKVPEIIENVIHEGLTDHEIEILDSVKSGKSDVDDIIRTLNLSTSDIIETITMLELKNVLVRRGNKIKIRIS